MRSCWGLLGNLFKGMTLTGTFHWPSAPFSCFLLGEWPWSPELQQLSRIMSNTRKTTDRWGEQRRKTKRGPSMKLGSPKFLKGWNESLVRFSTVYQPNRIDLTWHSCSWQLFWGPQNFGLFMLWTTVEPNSEPNRHSCDTAERKHRSDDKLTNT